MIHEVTNDDRLKCSICKHYLSVSPVFVLKNGSSICVKCNEGKESDTVRNLTYEALATSCKFPCRYKNAGCKENYPFEGAKKHEEECPYRDISCFHCKWTGNFVTLESHFRLEHPDLLLYLPTEIKPEITSNSSKKYLIPALRNLFIVHIKYSVASSTLSVHTCFVGKLQNTPNFEYSIEVTPHHGNGHVKLTKSVQYITDLYSPIELNIDIIQKQLMARYKDCKFNFSIQSDSQYIFRNAFLNSPLYRKEHKEDFQKCKLCSHDDTSRNLSKHYYWFCPVSDRLRFCLVCKELIERKSTFAHYVESHLTQDSVYSNNILWLKDIDINLYRIALCTAFDAMFLVIIKYCDKSRYFKCNIVSNLPSEYIDVFECIFQLCNPNTGFTSTSKVMAENDTDNGEYDWRGFIDGDDFEEFVWVTKNKPVKKLYNVKIVINRKGN